MAPIPSYFYVLQHNRPLTIDVLHLGQNIFCVKTHHFIASNISFSPCITNDRLETASKIARNYCLIKDDMFVLPSRDDLVEHRVVVTTLSTSQVLLDLQVLHGFFTHILIDEAAQALEPAVLTPLIFAGPNTKVVLTGDHMQVLHI